MPRRFVHRHQDPLHPRSWIKAALGGLIGVGVVAMLGEWSGLPLLVAPLGASAVLLFGLPDNPLSQPANLVGGHLIATTLALLLDAWLPDSFWAIALAVGLVIGVLGLTRLTHPPAGADPIVVMMAHPGWDFLLTPVLAGTVLLVLLALAIHRLPPRVVYPLPVSRSG
jgi:CBS-domain-containing membrane protein